MAKKKVNVFKDFAHNRAFYDSLLHNIFVQVLLPEDGFYLEPDDLFLAYDGRRCLKNGRREVRLGEMLTQEKIDFVNEAIREGRRVPFRDIVHLREWAKQTFGLNDCSVCIASENINWDYPYYRHNLLV